MFNVNDLRPKLGAYWGQPFPDILHQFALPFLKERRIRMLKMFLSFFREPNVRSWQVLAGRFILIGGLFLSLHTQI